MNLNHVDFLPPRYRALNLEQKLRKRKLVAVGVVAIWLAVLTCFAYRQRDEVSFEMRVASGQYQSALDRVAEVEELDRKKIELSRKLDVLRNVLLRTRGASVFHAVATACPESARIAKMDLRARDKDGIPEIDVVVEGICPDHIDAAQFMASLERSELIYDVNLVRSEIADAHRSEKRYIITAQSPGLAEVVR